VLLVDVDCLVPSDSLRRTEKSRCMVLHTHTHTQTVTERNNHTSVGLKLITECKEEWINGKVWG